MRQNKRWTIRKVAFLAAAVLLVAAALSGCGDKGGKKKASPEDNEAVATYKGGQITRGELNAYMNVNKLMNPDLAVWLDNPDMAAYFSDQMLRQLAALKVAESEASDSSKQSGEEQTAQYMEELEGATKEELKEFDNRLKELGLTRDDFRSFLRLTFTALEEADSRVTDEKIEEVYNERLQQDPYYYTIATVRHILVALQDPNDNSVELRTKEEALKRIQEVKGKLDNGGDFAALAKQYSDDPGSKDNGGLIENYPIAGYVENFKKAAGELPIGQISDPIETEYGYHVLVVESRSQRTLEENKEALRAELGEAWLTELMYTGLDENYEFQSLLSQESDPSPSPTAETDASPSPEAGDDAE